MKLKQIEEIATRQIPIWQPTLLITLLLLGNVLIPMILKEKELKPPKKESLGSTLGIESIKKQVNEELKNVKPLTDQLQKEAEKVLGVAQTVQQTVQNVATQSTEKAKEFVFDNTLGKVLQNINTLPADQQDLIKKAICK